MKIEKINHQMRSMEIMKNYSHKVWKNEKFSLTEEKNSSNQLLSNFFSKTITFTEFLRKRMFVEKREILSHWQKIWSNQLFSNFFNKTIAFTTFLQKNCEKEFLQFPPPRDKKKTRNSLTKRCFVKSTLL